MAAASSCLRRTVADTQLVKPLTCEQQRLNERCWRSHHRVHGLANGLRTARISRIVAPASPPVAECVLASHADPRSAAPRQAAGVCAEGDRCRLIAVQSEIPIVRLGRWVWRNFRAAISPRRCRSDRRRSRRATRRCASSSRAASSAPRAPCAGGSRASRAASSPDRDSTEEEDGNEGAVQV